MSKVNLVQHPLIQHKLSILREESTTSAQFRLLLKEISILMIYEATRDFQISFRELKTPLETMQAPTLAEKKIVLVSVMRAGNGLLDGALEMIPSAQVGFVGIFRDEQTLKAIEYYCKLPQSIVSGEVIILDPMLATANSIIAAIDRVKQSKPKRIKVINVLGSPEGLEALTRCHPDVEVYLAAIDRQLNEHGYILPGLGDAGDRLFGTN